jgi:tetratricopeptide (TPR) repeat protein
MRIRVASFLLLLLTAACAPKAVPLPTVSSPRFPDFIAPVVPAAFATTAAAGLQVRGWTFLQAGDLKNAEREFAIAVKSSPDFYPAEVGLAYVDLAEREYREALTRFDRVLDRQPAEPAALVGLGEANLGLNREADALRAFEAAVAADPLLTEIARRVEVLKFRVAEQRLADARAAAAAGRADDAVRAYSAAIESSPASAFLYRELAVVERQRGDDVSALRHFRAALDIDPMDASSLVGIGEILEAQGDFEAAAKTYEDAQAIEPTPELRAKLEAVRARAELARLPAEYRAIESAPQVTRADLAALIGVRLTSLLQADARADAEPITDVRGDWAAPWILLVSRAGVMQPFANHTFQPRAVIRRIDLAEAAQRVLARIAAANPLLARTWQSARVQFSDMAPTHLAYPAASAAVASGVLATLPDGSFQPSRIVTGAEATQTVRRLEELAGAAALGKAQR